eukprot:CAMPEP_0114272766 /NCGR_PEP_ID=MMETSP0058-20121206/28672_1 /TAXON_ID=36894 /ORGANISM="Pyramimonas parkeae, CCMP726" /LENGTH=32 /DNA_ID= /DNA_START= /DNA_END= /DNA_ORIENTATION=
MLVALRHLLDTSALEKTLSRLCWIMAVCEELQ